MKTLGAAGVRLPGPAWIRLVAVPWCFLLIVLVACFAAPAAAPRTAFADTQAFGSSAQARHIASLPLGRTVLAALRPVAKKAASKGADPALPVADGAPQVLAAVGLGLPLQRDARRLLPAPSGYFARAPPRQA